MVRSPSRKVLGGLSPLCSANALTRASTPPGHVRTDLAAGGAAEGPADLHPSPWRWTSLAVSAAYDRLDICIHGALAVALPNRQGVPGQPSTAQGVDVSRSPCRPDHGDRQRAGRGPAPAEDARHGHGRHPRVGGGCRYFKHRGPHHRAGGHGCRRGADPPHDPGAHPTHSFPARSGRGLGVWAAVAWGGQAAGPAFGGLLTQTIGQRWICLVNLHHGGDPAGGPGGYGGVSRRERPAPGSTLIAEATTAGPPRPCCRITAGWIRELRRSARARPVRRGRPRRAVRAGRAAGRQSAEIDPGPVRSAVPSARRPDRQPCP